MKKLIFTLAIIAFIAVIVVPLYGQESDKNSVKSGENLKGPQKDSNSEYQKFKKESEEKIIAYEKKIAELKARIADEKKEDRAKYEKKLAELEQKNSDMKKKLDEYKDEGKDKWTSFKSEFNHDMDGLEKALKDFTIDNKK